MNVQADNKMLKDFLKHQMMVVHSTVPGPTSNKIMNLKAEETAKKVDDLSVDFIIAKKPAAAKVRKFLQGLIDEIVAEQED